MALGLGASIYIEFSSKLGTFYRVVEMGYYRLQLLINRCQWVKTGLGSQDIYRLVFVLPSTRLWSKDSEFFWNKQAYFFFFFSNENSMYFFMAVQCTCLQMLSFRQPQIRYLSVQLTHRAPKCGLVDIIGLVNNSHLRQISCCCRGNNRFIRSYFPLALTLLSLS